MVDTIFPTPQTYTSRQGRQTIAPLVAGATAARPLGGLTGVRPGTPASTVTATTALVTVQPFAGVADVQTLGIAGPYTFAFDTVTTFPLTAQSATVPRSDIVFVTINDNQEDGSGALNSSSAVRGYLAGTTVVIPAAPARSLIIAVINVPITGSSPTITWTPQYCVAAGGVLPVSGSVQYPASPSVGQYVDDPAKALLRWNGAGWVPPITLPTCHLTTTVAGATSGTVGAFTAVPYNVTGFDATAMHSNVTLNTRITVTVPGVYRATHKVQTTSTTFDSAVGIFVNGSLLAESIVYAPRNSTNGAFPMVSHLVKLNAADYVEAGVAGTAAGLSLGSVNCFFELQFVSN